MPLVQHIHEVLHERDVLGWGFPVAPGAGRGPGRRHRAGARDQASPCRPAHQSLYLPRRGDVYPALGCAGGRSIWATTPASRRRSFPASDSSGQVPSCTIGATWSPASLRPPRCSWWPRLAWRSAAGFISPRFSALALILVCLFLLGNAEQRLNLKLAVHSYEVTGRNADDIKAEVNARAGVYPRHDGERPRCRNPAACASAVRSGRNAQGAAAGAARP